MLEALIAGDMDASAMAELAKGRLREKKAAVGVGHSILVIAYHLLERDTTYQELGANYFDELKRNKVERQAVSRLEGSGYKVLLEPAA